MFKCVRFLRIRRASRGWAANFRLFLVEIRVVRCCSDGTLVFRLDALALSVIATATWLAGWLAGWVAGCHTPVLYQNG